MSSPVPVPPKLESQAVIDDTFWITYICCGGCGFGGVKDPLVGAITTTLTDHAVCNTTDLKNDDGFCGCISVQMSNTAQCQCPPIEGAPKCVCFNIPLAKGGTISKKKGLIDYASIFDQTWWYVYMFCCGYGISGLQAGKRPVMGAYNKFLIVETYAGMQENEWPGASNGLKSFKAGLCDDAEGVCMEQVLKCLCLYQQVKIPPDPKNRKCACCNKTLIPASQA